MSFNRKQGDARHHYWDARRKTEPAHCKANQTGMAAYRMSLEEAMLEEAEALDAFESDERLDAEEVAFAMTREEAAQ